MNLYKKENYTYPIAQAPEGKGRDWESDEPPTVGENQVQDQLRSLKMHRSVGPDEMYLGVLRELVGEADKPLSILSEKAWQASELPTDGMRGNTTPIFKKGKWKTTGQSVSSLCLAR